MADLLTFYEAIEHSAQFKKRHLLLGNGFSIACRPKIFTYGSLFEQADFSSAPRLPAVFDAVGTTDFEHVIKMLEDASRVVPVYSKEAAEAAAQMAVDAEALKDILIQTVANNHPNIPNEINDEQFWACRRFLAHFLGDENKDGKVYTLNYDLLLYWTLMHDDMGFDDPISLAANDGFGRDEDTEPEYVNWMGESGAHGQRVHYLHGALHLFDAGAELQKYTWVNTGKPLLEQAREAMGARKFPLFVAEGKSNQKLAKIKHSAYLHHSYKSFSSQMGQRNDALFIFGHSLAENDQHILKKIARGKIGQIYVGLYGDPNSDGNKAISSAANDLTAYRDERVPLSVAFFDAGSAQVWGA
ncbi:DUF4917 family protein [Rhodobacter maris]|uniref:Uncharacterized protein DUF4917 n=1 Tax=Rhodobacter maris TaxID=446682 RepID=A0A285T8R5_9RHOB|nr:DUF4917 family protein [Rhodobacter maris]SOC17336.1 uncharacterized protein DUF4917 [Rhodobacter maris]